MAASSLKRSPLTAATVTPPHLNRQHSQNAKAETGKPKTDATTSLADVASRTNPPRRKSQSPAENQDDRRLSWEECTKKRDGYVSFPDFDQLRAEHQCSVR